MAHDRSRSPSEPGIRALALLVATLVLAPSVACTSDPGRELFVAPSGQVGHDGRSRETPFARIQAAIDLAEPGDVVRILPGEYLEDLETRRDGRPGSPIRLVGVPDANGRRPVVRGAGESHIVDVRHSHVWLEDLAVDGLFGDPSDAAGYRSKLLYASGSVGEAGFEGLKGVRLLRLVLRNAGTECVRFRYEVVESEIAESLVENCGVWDFRFGRGRKNGEAIYVGTAPEQLPDHEAIVADASNGNWIHHNFLRSNGAECVDVKEGAEANRIERNDCSGLRDTESGGISIRGTRNIVRANVVHDNAGAGIRLGGDRETDGIQNEVVGNELYRNAYAAFKVIAQPQARLCGNRVRNGDTLVRGRDVDALDPRGACR